MRALKPGGPKLQFGVVLDRGNAYVPGNIKHPLKKAAVLAGITLKQHYVKVINMADKIEFIKSSYVTVVIPATAMQAHFSIDDLREIADALGVGHPTVASLMAQVLHPKDESSKEEAIQEGLRFLEYVKSLQVSNNRLKSTKNYYADSYG